MPRVLPDYKLPDLLPGQEIVYVQNIATKIISTNSARTRRRTLADGKWVEPPVTPPPASAWSVEYFDNITLAGTPKSIGVVSNVGGDWAAGSPAGLPADNYSARYTRDITFETGNYEFVATADDGVRVKVDGQLIINEWRDQGATSFKKTIPVTAGKHSVVVEFYEHTGLATLAMTYAKAGTTPPPVDPPVDPPPGPPGTFMAYPRSGVLNLNGVSGQIIEKLSFEDTPAKRSSIVLNGCSDILIRNVDFRNVPGCIYVVGGGNIRIEDCRYQDITGPSVRIGDNVGNFVQFNGVQGGHVRRIKGKSGGDTEDIFSVYQTSNMVLEDCHVEGTNWQSASGSGMMLGDSGGSNNVARRNILVNPGQVGIGIAGGTNCLAEDNILICEGGSRANIALYVADYGGGACGGHKMLGNRVNWINAAGNQNSFWTDGACGGVEESTIVDTSLKASDYRVTL